MKKKNEIRNPQLFGNVHYSCLLIGTSLFSDREIDCASVSATDSTVCDVGEIAIATAFRVVTVTESVTTVGGALLNVCVAANVTLTSSLNATCDDVANLVICQNFAL